ncbi:TPA: hypothetical protein JG946_003768 [Enterobacter hormaechei subsp. steigerwaltii]|nr:hypothetical protein [Enterobacter hormaechei subsp. steigerwaltii]
MGWDTIIALLISVTGFIYTFYKDKSNVIDELEKRIGKLETNTSLQQTAIERLEKFQEELKTDIKDLRGQVHQLDLKIERVLTLLEKEK